MIAYVQQQRICPNCNRLYLEPLPSETPINNLCISCALEADIIKRHYDRVECICKRVGSKHYLVINPECPIHGKINHVR